MAFSRNSARASRQTPLPERESQDEAKQKPGRELSKIRGGKNEEGHEYHATAILVLEDDNKYDKNAVRVEIMGLKVGCVPKEDAKGMRKSLSDAGAVGMAAQANAIIRGGWKREDGDEGDFGVVLDISWRD